MKAYRKLQKDLNVTHVLENPRLLGEGTFCKVFECYNQTTITEPSNSIEDQKNSKEILTNSSANIAYKSNKYFNPGSDMSNFSKYCYNQENKALEVFDHPNIIKKATCRLNNDPTTKLVSFKVKSLSEIDATKKMEIKEVHIPIDEMHIPVNDEVHRPVDDDSIDGEFEFVDMPEMYSTCIPLELAEITLLDKLKEDPMTPKEKHHCILSILKAVNYMHEKGYAHLDLSLDNIIKKDGNWLLCDFGLVHHFSEMYKGTKENMPLYITKNDLNSVGKLEYMPPEVYARTMWIHIKTDFLHTAKPSEPSMRNITNATKKPTTGDLSYLYADAREIDAYCLGKILYLILLDQHDYSIHEKTHSYARQIMINSDPKACSDLYQKLVNVKLSDKKNGEKIGQYMDVVEGLWLSDRNNRLTVPAALKMVEEMDEPQ